MLRGRLSLFLAYQATNKIDPLISYSNMIMVCLDFMNLAMDLDLRDMKSKFLV